MLILKQELCEFLSRMSPRTFAYMNELDYPNLLLELEHQDITLPTTHQLQRSIQFPQYQPPSHQLNNQFINLRDEAESDINDEKLRFLQFYPVNQHSEMLSAYSRMTQLKIKTTVKPLKLSFPLDPDTLTDKLNLPPAHENRDIPLLLYMLQKLLSELKNCNLKFSIQDNIIEIIYPSHIVKVFINLYKNNQSIYPLQIFVSAYCRYAPFIEQMESISMSTSKEVLTNVDKLFLLILELPERLTRQEFSLSQKNYDLAEKLFFIKG
ncbi:hypothetical protein V6C68_01830 [Staphylococcus capitis subsp. urealyticus]|uniref:hypothetical protein n=1 Tax=Staphylococcus capitis TaxID=29388 RepID=UPI003457428C